jgi:glycosyltransferase 2 family protein
VNPLSSVNTKVKTALKLIVSFGILFYFFSILDYEKFLGIIPQVSPVFILLLLLLIILRNILAAFRFKYLAAVRRDIGILALTRQYFIAAMFNMFLPTALGGDSVRVFLLSECRFSKKDSLILILIERIIGFFSLILISLVAVFFFEVPDQILYLVVGISAAYFLLILMLFVLPLNTRFRKINLFKKINDNIQIFHRIRSDKPLLSKTLILSFVYQLASISLSYTVALAFDIRIPFVVFLGFVPLVWLFMMIPVSLGGLGLREVAFVYLFAMVGIEKETALIISLGTFLALILNGLIGAGVFFYDKIILGIKYPTSSSTSDSN